MDATSTALAAYKQFLRRTYATNLPGLRALAEQLVAELADGVTITAQTFEGGSHSGQITMPPGLKLSAVEELLIELDTTGTAPRAATRSVCYVR